MKRNVSHYQLNALYWARFFTACLNKTLIPALAILHKHLTVNKFYMEETLIRLLMIPETLK